MKTWQKLRFKKDRDWQKTQSRCTIVPRPLREDDSAPVEFPTSVTKNQVERLFEKFGGQMGLVRALATVGRPRSASSVYRWNYAHDNNGRAGLVPASAWPDIITAARHEGILITAEDMDVMETDPTPRSRYTPEELELRRLAAQRAQLKFERRAEAKIRFTIERRKTKVRRDMRNERKAKANG